jgi:serine/threonine protein kinase/Flp pilus assembly protein TadD
MSDHNTGDDQTRTHVVLGPGVSVNKYRILEKIGAGGMGEVYLAEDTELGRRVALKFLPAHLVDDSDLRSRFTREAQAAAKLDHPNIVTIHEVGDFNGRPFFAMQYIEGKTVRHYCQEEQLSMDRIINLAMKVSEGLSKAHASGVTHRDVKSANIIIDNDSRVKILDFGLATIQGSEQLTKAGSTLGTVAYMSPEQAQGQPTDHRSDLFSLGVVLYELISGKTPFKRNNDAGTIHAIIHDSPEPLLLLKTDTPPALDHSITKCLAKNPAERYQSAADLTADLRAMTGSHSVEVSGSIVSRPEAQPSIAVLPFVNMSADPENEFFSDGLTEELLNVLAKNPGLKVTGRTSCFAFKGKQEDLRAIGQKLGVRTLLEGSVRKASNRVRITAQLVNTSDGFHLWSETYDRVIEDIFAVQDEIAQAVSSAMHVTLLGEPSEKRAVNPEAYALVLRANHSGRLLTDSGSRTAVELYQQAIDLDPEYAQAWAGLARTHVMNAGFGFGDVQVAYGEAKKAASRAMELNDRLAEAHEVMGLVRVALEFDFDGAANSFRRAYDLAPNDSRNLSSLSLACMFAADFDEARQLSERSVELDPLNPETLMNHGRLLMWTGELVKARNAYKRALELSPTMAGVHMLYGWTYLLEDKLDKALEITQTEEVNGYRNCGLAMIYHAKNMKAESDKALEKLLTLGDQWGFQFACVYAYRGESDKAFEWLEKSRALRDPGIPISKVSPFLKSLHSDPRWPEFLAKLGLSA